MKILVVDDMASMRKVILRMLNSLGHSYNDEAKKWDRSTKYVAFK